MIVRPNTLPVRDDIQTFYSEEYHRVIDNPDDFMAKSSLMLKTFIKTLLKQPKRKEKSLLSTFTFLQSLMVYLY